MEHIAALLFVVGRSNTLADCRELEVPDGTLAASLEVSTMLVASNGARPKKTILNNSKIGQAKPVFSC